MSMRSNRYEREEPPPRGKCLRCICVSWKVFSYVFSHVTLIALVVLYCVGGGFLFQSLEEDNEREVRMAIKFVCRKSHKVADVIKLELNAFTDCRLAQVEWKILL
jgi:hypothetical protein